MQQYYTDERNAQIVISLMKKHNVRKVIISPGTTNICFAASIQHDSFFEIYSAPDERSAGYMACGLSAECQEPVALSCTGATSSRNYMPALTEAYYRKLPILAITSSRRNSRIGHNFDQVTDRTALPNDVVKLSVQMPLVHDDDSEWACMIAGNKALLELRRNGGGPVHINLETNYSLNSVKSISDVRAIYRITSGDKFPKLQAQKVAIMVGAHLKWKENLVKEVEKFCEKYNGVVLCDHTSNYNGKYGINPNLATMQSNYMSVVKKVDLMIHIGDITSSEYGIKAKSVWRVNPDGEIRDTYGKLQYVFEMEEEEFFHQYTEINTDNIQNVFYEECKIEQEEFYRAIPELPFSNAWVAQKTAPLLPDNAVLHMGIRNSLRCWNLFALSDGIRAYANTGGFGIDGCLSSLIGASLADKEKLYFAVLGDLAFFYDMNSLGNRHVGNNIRILLINNGIGMEMCFSSNLASTIGVEKDKYIGAGGHYGNKSLSLVKHYAEDLGFQYLSASNKEQYLNVVNQFVSSDIDKPIILEVFTEEKNEDLAYAMLSEIKKESSQVAKNTLRNVLGEKNVNKIKSFLKK